MIPKQRIRTRVRKMTNAEVLRMLDHQKRRLDTIVEDQNLRITHLEDEMAVYKDMVAAYKDGEAYHRRVLDQRNSLIAQKLELLCRLENKVLAQNVKIKEI